MAVLATAEDQPKEPNPESVWLGARGVGGAGGFGSFGSKAAGSPVTGCAGALGIRGSSASGFVVSIKASVSIHWAIAILLGMKPSAAPYCIATRI